MALNQKIKNLPQHAQFAYGAQPSPISGAMLVFLNELSEMIGELQTSINALVAEKDNAGFMQAMGEIGDRISQSMTDLSATVKANQPKPPNMAGITKALNDMAASAELSGNRNLRQLLEANGNIIIRMDALIGRIEALSRPKTWNFDIKRDNLDGHIIGVTATSKTKEN